jgi:hypothetical protein
VSSARRDVICCSVGVVGSLLCSGFLLPIAVAAAC